MSMSMPVPFHGGAHVHTSMMPFSQTVAAQRMERPKALVLNGTVAHDGLALNPSTAKTREAVKMGRVGVQVPRASNGVKLPPLPKP